MQRDKLFTLKVYNAFSNLVYVRCLSYYLFTYVTFSPYPGKDLTLGKAARCSRRDPQKGQLKAVCSLYSQKQDKFSREGDLGCASSCPSKWWNSAASSNCLSILSTFLDKCFHCLQCVSALSILFLDLPPHTHFFFFFSFMVLVRNSSAMFSSNGDSGHIFIITSI